MATNGYSNGISGTEPRGPNGESFEDFAVQGKALQDKLEFSRAIDKYGDAIRLGAAPYGLMGFVYSNMGRCYMYLEMFDRALNYNKCHLDCAVAAQDEEMECLAWTNVGISYYATSQYVDAIDCHERSLTLANRLGLPEGQMRAFANLGNCYGCQGQFQQAIIHHEQQLRVATSIGDQEAIARACFNLESDHNSLGHYDIALTYAKKKQLSKAGKLRLNEGFGDKKPGSDVKTGWLIKHFGADQEGPSKLGKAKRWCILREGIFAYHKTVKHNVRAQRYIRVSDIQEVEQFHLKGSNQSEASDTFRILVADRAFFFSCASTKECRDWVQGFQQSRTGPGLFNQREIRGRTATLAAPASQYFSSEGSNMSLQQGKLEEPNPTKMFEREPSAFKEDKRVDNPLFGLKGFSRNNTENSLETYDDPDAEKVRTHQLLGAGDDIYATAGGVRARKRDSDKRRKEGEPEEIALQDIQVDGIESTAWTEGGSTPVKFLGSAPQEVKPDEAVRPPTTNESHAAYIRLEKHPRALFEQRLAMTVDEEHVVTKPSFDGADPLPEDIRRYKLEDLVNVLSFDHAVILVLEETSIGVKHYTYHIYITSTVSEAGDLKRIIARRSQVARSKIVKKETSFMQKRMPEPNLEESVMEVQRLPAPKRLPSYDEALEGTDKAATIEDFNQPLFTDRSADAEGGDGTLGTVSHVQATDEDGYDDPGRLKVQEISEEGYDVLPHFKQKSRMQAALAQKGNDAQSSADQSDNEEAESDDQSDAVVETESDDQSDAVVETESSSDEDESEKEQRHVGKLSIDEDIFKGHGADHHLNNPNKLSIEELQFNKGGAKKERKVGKLNINEQWFTQQRDSDPDPKPTTRRSKVINGQVAGEEAHSDGMTRTTSKQLAGFVAGEEAHSDTSRRVGKSISGLVAGEEVSADSSNMSATKALDGAVAGEEMQADHVNTTKRNIENGSGFTHTDTKLIEAEADAAAELFQLMEETETRF